MSATLAEWLARLEASHPRGSDGIELGLDRVRAVSQRLGQHRFCPTILVGGTNGKGSTCAMLERILHCAGYRIGRYASPHLLRYNERVRVGLADASDSQLVAAFERVEAARDGEALTYFEAGTLAAWEVFAAAAVDAVILEVGLGGRLDATNIYPADACVITTVDLDHEAFLGPDREAIGREKAGIFRRDIPAVCADPDPPQSLLVHAEAVGAPLRRIGRDFGYQVIESHWLYWSRESAGAVRRRGGLAHPALRGGIQLANAAAAIAALECVHDALPVAMKDVRQGLLEVELTGRFQVVPGRPTVVLDVAHNPQSARVLADNLGSTGFYPRTWAVFGMLADKDIDAVIAAIGGRVTHWIPCALEGRRAAGVDFLRQRLEAHGATVVAAAGSVAQGLALARERAGDDDRILAFGSFLTVADALRALGRTS